LLMFPEALIMCYASHGSVCSGGHPVRVVTANGVRNLPRLPRQKNKKLVGKRRILPHQNWAHITKVEELGVSIGRA
jgi:hypothetical protein